MGIHSGRFGVVNGQSTVRNWSVSETADVKQYIASNTRGGSGRQRGNLDATGNFSRYGGKPILMPNDVFTFQGYTAPGDDVEGSNGPIYQLPAIVDQVAISWNWQAGDIISHAVNFGLRGQTGPFEQLADGLYSDATDPDVPSVNGLVPLVSTLGGSSGFDAIECVLNATLTLSAAVQTFVNSCSAGRVGRVSGNIDWSLAITVQNDDLASLPFEVNDLVALQLPIDDTDEWQLTWGIVRDFSNIMVDRESGAIVSFTVNIDMAGFDNDTGDVGSIILPGETDPWWPLTP